MTSELIEYIERGDVSGLEGYLATTPQAKEDLEGALRIAVRTGKTKLFRVLVKYGASIRSRDEQTTWSLLHTAVEHRQLDSIRELVALGADLNAADAEGGTPLHLAVDVAADSAVHSGGEPDTGAVRLLLDLGADSHKSDTRGRTPRKMAEEWMMPRLIDMF